MNFYSLIFLLLTIKLSQLDSNSFYIVNGNFKYEFTSMTYIRYNIRSFFKRSLNEYKVPIVKMPNNLVYINNSFSYNKSIIFYPYYKNVIIDDGTTSVCTKAHCLIKSKTIEERIICCSDYFYSGLYITVQDAVPPTSIQEFFANTYTYNKYIELSNIKIIATDKAKMSFFDYLLSKLKTTPKIIYT